MHALISYSINFKFSHNPDKYISNHLVFFLFSHTLLFICALHNNLYLYNLMHKFTNHFYHSLFLHNLYRYIFHLSVSLHFSSTSSFILASNNNYLYLFFFFSHACPHFSFNPLHIFTQYTQLYFKSFSPFIFSSHYFIYPCISKQ